MMKHLKISNRLGFNGFKSGGSFVWLVDITDE